MVEKSFHSFAKGIADTRLGDLIALDLEPSPYHLDSAVPGSGKLFVLTWNIPRHQPDREIGAIFLQRLHVKNRYHGRNLLQPVSSRMSEVAFGLSPDITCDFEFNSKWLTFVHLKILRQKGVWGWAFLGLSLVPLTEEVLEIAGFTSKLEHLLVNPFEAAAGN